MPATYYSRGTHGTRTDVVEIYDVEHLSPQAEVVIPPKRATNAVALAHAALSDDDRFVAIFNWTTGTSLSIVDVANRASPARSRRRGAASSIPPARVASCRSAPTARSSPLTLDDDGQRGEPRLEQAVLRSEGRPGDREGGARSATSGSSSPSTASCIRSTAAARRRSSARRGRWSRDADKAESWRIGGNQHLAVHRASGRLYALMHRGGADTHKDPGEEVWIFDIATPAPHRARPVGQSRLHRLRLPDQPPAGRWRGVVDWLLDRFAPPLVGYIAVTQDDAPAAGHRSQFSGIARRLRRARPARSCAGSARPAGPATCCRRRGVAS